MSLSPDLSSELLLVLSDIDISRVTVGLRELLEASKDKFSQVVCLGNVASAQTLDFVKSLNKNTFILKGDFDDPSSLPSSRSFTIRSFTFAAIHGHQVFPWGDEEALLSHFNDLPIDIILTGTPSEPRLSKLYDKAIVSPGCLGGGREDGGVGREEGGGRRREGGGGRKEGGGGGSFCVLEVSNGVEGFWYREENGGVVVERATICQGRK